MKKYIIIIISILILGGMVFSIAGNKEAHAPNMQDLDGPMRKINVEDTDPAIVAECNRQIRTTTFESEIESDRFFLECINLTSDMTESERIESERADMCSQMKKEKNFSNDWDADEFFTKCIEGGVSLSKESELEKSATFTGELEKVDTGCFADGECFVIVDGKHVTALVGRRREVVGQVVGIETGFDGLEELIGKQIEVYAHKVDAKNYTLYGSEDYYIKVL